MTAFPSGAGNNVSTAHLDSAQDQPKNARTDLLDAVNKINAIINSFNANDGICGLTSGGKVDSAKLIGQIDTAQLVADAVDGTKIADDSIDSEHIVDGSVDKVHTSFISQATIDNTATNDVVPTQLAVKSFVDSEVGAIDTNLPYAILDGTTKSSGSDSAFSAYYDGTFTITGTLSVTQSGGTVTLPSGVYLVNEFWSAQLRSFTGAGQTNGNVYVRDGGNNTLQNHYVRDTNNATIYESTAQINAFSSTTLNRVFKATVSTNNVWKYYTEGFKNFTPSWQFVKIG